MFQKHLLCLESYHDVTLGCVIRPLGQSIQQWTLYTEK